MLHSIYRDVLLVRDKLGELAKQILVLGGIMAGYS